MSVASSTNGHANGHSISRVFPSHLEDLRRSGLTDTTIETAGIYSEGGGPDGCRRLGQLLNRKSWSVKNGTAFVIPYFDASGTKITSRVKPDSPIERSGKAAKFLSPTGASVRVYFPPGTHQKIESGATEVIITEGEKKALAGWQAGYCVLGLAGVSCWHAKKSATLLPDLELAWAGRKVFIAFDSDAVDNSQVLQDESLLASQLKKRGAVVRVLRFPAGPDGAKVGLDDYLVAHGAGALRRLMDTAGEPEELPPEVLRTHANEADPADLAERFRKSLKFDGVSRLVFWRGTFWYWQNGGYRELDDNDLRAKLTEFIARDYFQVKRADVGNAVMHLQSQSLLPSHCDAPLWLSPTLGDWAPLECIATKSGIVHLPSLALAGEAPLRTPTPRFFTTAAVGYAFDPAPTPAGNWLAFLRSLWPDDPQSIETLQEFMGYLLTPDTSQQKLLMIVGPKRSGKGTILRVLRELIGVANVAAPTLSSLQERFGLWPLLGKLAAIISDARLSGRVDQATIVERILSVTGEDAQSVDRKNLQPVTVKLPTRFVIVTNELPRLGDASGALVSRMLLLRTTNSFYGNEDHGLTDRLLAELPGIFPWAAVGWHRLRERGYFVQPDSSKDLLQDLDDLSSPISVFVRERCEVGAERTVWVDDLYSDWARWCLASGRQRPSDKATFGRDLVAYIPSVRKIRPRSEDGERRYGYEGIGLRLWS